MQWQAGAAAKAPKEHEAATGSNDVPARAMPAAPLRSPLRSQPAAPLRSPLRSWRSNRPHHIAADWITTLTCAGNRFHVWLGTSQAASDTDWLRRADVNLLVCCLPLWHEQHVKPPAGCWEVTWSWEPRDSFHDFKVLADAKIRLLWNTTARLKNVLFYCKRGKHRSACALACFLLAGPPFPKDASEVMTEISNRRPCVEPGAQLRACQCLG